MADAMMPGAVARRRLGYAAAIVVLLSAFIWMETLYAGALRRASFFNGWVLIAGVVFLALFNVRKKLPMIPLGSASAWTRLHACLGFFTVGVFFLHGGFGIPQGTLDLALWAVFLIVALSGIGGLYLSRAVPARLGEVQERILLERIPRFRAQLAREVAGIAERSIGEEVSLTIASFYSETLHDFMRGPRNLLAHLRGSRQPLMAICDSIKRIERYVDDAGRARLAEIRERVIAKNDLDCQYAHLLLLRLWLFVHIPATYSLIVLAAVHVMAAYAFSSGAP
jgi:hypothetical protein